MPSDDLTKRWLKGFESAFMAECPLLPIDGLEGESGVLERDDYTLRKEIMDGTNVRLGRAAGLAKKHLAQADNTQ